MKNNLLNNQNYILWKTEKKKLLSKFFVEKNIQTLYILLSWFYFLITNMFKYVLVIIFILFIWFIFFAPILSTLYNVFLYPKILTVVLWLLFWGFIIFIFYKIIWSYKTEILRRMKKMKIKKIWNFSDFFRTPKINFNNVDSKSVLYLFPTYLLLLWIVSTFLLKLEFAFNQENIAIFVIAVLLVWIPFIKINFYSLLLTPILLIIWLINIFLSLIYVFIIKGVVWYQITKYYPWNRFFEKFTKFNKQYAKNNYYKIELKK